MDDPDSQNELERPVNVDREQRLLDAAARLIAHYGYDKTTVSDIAQEAGVSKGAVYLHWSSKEALFEALLLREIQAFTTEWLELIEADPDGGKLHAMYLHSLAVIERRPLLKALITRDKRVIGDFLRHQSAALFSRRNTMSQEFVRLMQQAGVVRADVDPKQVAYVLSCIRAGMIFVEELMTPEEIPPLEEAIAGLADFIERAFAPEGGGDSQAGKQVIRALAAALQDRWARGKLA
ncbi:MAG: TetR/AcrR family transcriptional regulator [Chloroflexi bacterium]|nr:TetR/AcrR family transcriptional regulator [Chloroflexota bacterium]